MTVKDTLIQARTILEGGWNKFGLTDSQGSYCLRGAIGLASNFYELGVNGELAMRRIECATASSEELHDYAKSLRLDLDAVEAVRRFLPQGFDSVPVFNDNWETTKEDVLSVLDKAISE